MNGNGRRFGVMLLTEITIREVMLEVEGMSPEQAEDLVRRVLERVARRYSVEGGERSLDIGRLDVQLTAQAESDPAALEEDLTERLFRQFVNQPATGA